jgi:hypothetical protein
MLICLIIRQFDLDTWHYVHQRHQNKAVLTPAAFTKYGPNDPPEFY